MRSPIHNSKLQLHLISKPCIAPLRPPNPLTGDEWFKKAAISERSLIYNLTSPLSGLVYLQYSENEHKETEASSATGFSGG